MSNIEVIGFIILRPTSVIRLEYFQPMAASLYQLIKIFLGETPKDGLDSLLYVLCEAARLAR